MKLLVSILFSFIILFIPTRVFAQTDAKFDVAIEADYVVAEDGVTTVTETVSITNKEDFIYTPTYTVQLGLPDISNVKVYNSAGNIPYAIEENEEGKDIEIRFPNRIVGKGRVNQFTFEFQSSKIAQARGNTWEVEIPGLADPEGYSTYTLDLQVPESFGSPTIIKPKKEISGSSFSFTKDEVGNAGIFLVFGTDQYFNLDLSYHLANPNLFPIRTEVALPPNTTYQEVLIERLDPKPARVYRDADGNWLAEYTLKPQENVDIKLAALVHVFAVPKPEPLSNPEQYLGSQKYWDAQDPEVKKLAQELKTPENIYNYVVETLSYNYEKVAEKNVRAGAKKALLTPENAVCLEFTDLFIAIARAAGIPARAVEGYGYTENSRLRPLSVSSDVLHAWPEYYDKARGTWIMVDPTWGNTTGGIDYFNSFDYEHIAFVIKGESSTYPIPAGGYKTNTKSKDVKVAFASPELFKPRVSIDVKDSIPENALSGLPIQSSIEIINNGNQELPASELSIDTKLPLNQKAYAIPPIPPFGSVSVDLDFGRAPILTNWELPITISYAGNTYNKSVTVSIIPRDYLYLIGGGLFVAFCIIFTIAIRAWRVHIQKQ